MAIRAFRRVVVAVAVTVLAAGCSRTTDEPAMPAPEPAPRGALYGRVMRPDGDAVAKAGVTLVQFDRADAVRAITAVMSLGVFCLLPADAFCPTNVGTTTAADGSFAFDPDEMKDTAGITLTASPRPGEDGRLPPETTLSTTDGSDPQRAPDLVLWAPEVTFQPEGDGLRVHWPALGGVPRGEKVDYTVTAVDRSPRFPSNPWPVAGPQPATDVLLDLREIEDLPVEVFVSATTEMVVDGRAVTFVYRSGSAPVPATARRPPPSRGAGCAVDAADGAVAPSVTPCPLTDGDLLLHQEVLLPGECSVDAHQACRPPPSHHRLCVDLGARRPVDLVVVRTPFPDHVRLELSADGRAFRDVGPVAPEPGDFRLQTYARRLEPPANATLVCVARDNPPFTGHHIRELSVWFAA